MSDRPPPTEANQVVAAETLLHRITDRIRQSLDLEKILAATVAEVRTFLDTDRVKVYRFQPDGTGQVIAESIKEQRLPSLLGLHFPATDIPPHARELFAKAGQRSIVDVAAQRITLSRLDLPLTTGDLTVEAVHHLPLVELLQRPVDPCHVEYLTAMGVSSSLVVPILHQDQLWGLLVSHHASPKTFSEQELQWVQQIANQVAIAIAQAELLQQTQQKAQREALINQIATLLHAPPHMQDILQLVLKKAVNAVEGSGGRLYLFLPETVAGIELATYGTQPDPINPDDPDLLLERSPSWQAFMASLMVPDQPPETEVWHRLVQTVAEPETTSGLPPAFQVEAIADLYQDCRFTELQPCFRSTPIRGLLVMPLRYGDQPLGCLTLFRNTIDTDIVWAGRFDPDDRQQRVRDSFAAWRELKQGQVEPWTEAEVELVRSLGIHLTLAVSQYRLYQYERQQRQLVEMRNQELRTARSIAETANRLKSDFLASTSHELRTPLASTLNYLKLLKEGFYDNEAELQEYIQIAYQSAENLVGIINDVLDLAKVEAGRMLLHLELVNLVALLQEQQRLFSLESRRKGIALKIDCQVEQVYADHLKLRQILTNLLSNAFKFTSQGEIQVRVYLQPITTTSGSDRPPLVEIAIQDSGIGIEMADQELLFEPFVQADGSIKRSYGGTGLGLTICKRMVELMGGNIWLYSPGPSQGTTVTFTLPYLIAEPGRSPAST